MMKDGNSSADWNYAVRRLEKMIHLPLVDILAYLQTEPGQLCRVLIDGTVTDIYGVVMETLKHLQPGTESITYEQLRTSMRAVIRDELPQKNEISRVLDKIAEISYTDSSSTPVIDWQSDSGLLTITDPFFAFFLKWSS